jgi:CheY-like chemotaxis protein
MTRQMSLPTPSLRNVLIASDNTTDATLVQTLLAGAFDHVLISTQEDIAAGDFERVRPRVLLLAFNTLAKAQRYAAGLPRPIGQVEGQGHRSIILCHKAEVREVSELCMQQAFDDYVLFWPMNHDAPRLRMAVHHALREIAFREAAPSAAAFAEQARKILELEDVLERHTVSVGRHSEGAIQAIRQVERGIDTALDGLSRRLHEGAVPGVARVHEGSALDREIGRIKRDEVQPPLRAAGAAIEPIQRRAAELRQECAPHLAAAHAIGALAGQALSTILVVDDDDLQQKLAAKALASPLRRLRFASSGTEALLMAGRLSPDLILMDVQMPGMDGIETTRRLKLTPQFAKVPVIMLTGNSDGKAVADSLKAGAVDFIVKPYDREKLAAKVDHWLKADAAAAAS